MEGIIYRKRESSEFSINITNKCPNACVFCIRNKTTGWFREVDGEPTNLFLRREPDLIEVIYAINQELDVERDSPINLIKFCGYGEPILRSDIIIEATKLLKVKSPLSIVQVNTSGWPYYTLYDNDSLLKEMMLVGVNTFSISLNAPNRDLYDKIVRPKYHKEHGSAFNDTIKFIKTVQKLGFEVKVSFVKTQEINQCIVDCIEFAGDLDVNIKMRELDRA